MTLKLSRGWLTFLFILLVPVLLYRSCDYFRYDSDPGDRLLADLASIETPGEVYCLSTATSFAWDTMYLFHNYENEHAIGKTIGTWWNGPEAGDNELLVFMNNSNVAAYVFIDGSNYPNLYLDNFTRQKYTKKTAHFHVFYTCRSGRKRTAYTLIAVDAEEAIINDYRKKANERCQ